MRAYVGSITHETNAFSPFLTRLEDYSPASIGYRDLIREATQLGCDVVYGLCARAAPSGPTVQEDYESLRELMVTEIRAEMAAPGQLDLVLLCLHGAQVAEGYDACEADIVAAVRAAVGDNVVVGVLLDLHASISEQLLQHASLVAAIKEYPHTDFPATARQLAGLCLRLAAGEITPITAYVPVPVFSLWHTPREPCRSLLEQARQLEDSGEVLHISLVHGFPWADVAQAGAAVLVTCDGDAGRAEQLASQFARALWDIRDADLNHYLSIAESIERATRQHLPGRPAVIADAADNPGAGTGGDGTWILRELLERGIEKVAVAMLWDPQSLDTILGVGEGATVALNLGGHTGPLSGGPLQVEALVSCINMDASIDAMPGYAPIPVGPLAAITVAGIHIVVAAYREQVFGPQVFTAVDIDPLQQNLLVLKSAQHFYSAFAPTAGTILYCDSPCSRTIDFGSLDFQHRRHPMWPLDECSAADIPAPLVFQLPRAAGLS